MPLKVTAGSGVRAVPVYVMSLMTAIMSAFSAFLPTVSVPLVKVMS